MGGETDSPEDSFIREDPDDLAVHQIVPWGGNPYVQYFGGWGSAGDGRWEAPEDTLYNLAVWIGGGREGSGPPRAATRSRGRGWSGEVPFPLWGGDETVHG